MPISEAGAVERSSKPGAGGHLRDGAGETRLLIGKENSDSIPHQPLVPQPFGERRALQFFVGLHQPSDAKRFERAFISVNRLRGRKKPLGAASWIMDSGAFTEISTHGRYRHSVEEYAAEIGRWTHDPALLAVVAQDYMCEEIICASVAYEEGLISPHPGRLRPLDIFDRMAVVRACLPLDPDFWRGRILVHQARTIERYDALVALVKGVYVMPVLQGYSVADYVRHAEDYGDRLNPDMLVGVGSVCKRNSDPRQIARILEPLARFGFRLHGFGLKTTALASSYIRELLFSADSMAWSFAARKQGRNANDWREAKAFEERIGTQAVEQPFLFAA